jgi:hypothetical protein
VRQRLLRTFTLPVAPAIAAALLLAPALFAIPLAAQEARVFEARLSWIPIDALMARAITGSGSVTARLTGTTLTVNGTFEGLQSPATVARIHRAQKGVRGPAVFDLTVTQADSGTITGTVELTASQIEDLGRERFYVQLHSEKAPEGNLWGWLLAEENRR